MGFFDSHTSGRIRKIIDDNASTTHSFLAHQLPDIAATALVPVAIIVTVFVIDWRLGIACLIPVIIALALMSFSMGTKGRQFMHSYMNALEEMNTEAVEYVRGIPVVKVFQQTIFSFKNFHRSITDYNRMVVQYSLMWEKPMFVLITPVFSGCVMKSMYLDQAMGQAGQAVERLVARFWEATEGHVWVGGVGVNAHIGVEGTYLSGGEQQRILLARAMLKNAPIIVLYKAFRNTQRINQPEWTVSEDVERISTLGAVDVKKGGSPCLTQSKKDSRSRLKAQKISAKEY